MGDFNIRIWCSYSISLLFSTSLCRLKEFALRLFKTSRSHSVCSRLSICLYLSASVCLSASLLYLFMCLSVLVFCQSLFVFKVFAFCMCFFIFLFIVVYLSLSFYLGLFIFIFYLGLFIFIYISLSLYRYLLVFVFFYLCLYLCLYSICLCLSAFVCYLYLCICLFVCIFLLVFLSVYLYLSLYMSLSLRLFICFSVFNSICLVVLVSLSVSQCLFLYMSLCICLLVRFSVAFLFRSELLRVCFPVCYWVAFIPRVIFLPHWSFFCLFTLCVAYAWVTVYMSQPVGVLTKGENCGWFNYRWMFLTYAEPPATHEYRFMRNFTTKLINTFSDFASRLRIIFYAFFA